MKKGKEMSVNSYPAAGTDGGSPNAEDLKRINYERRWHRWQDWGNLILGVWLFIAPWIWHSTTIVAAGSTDSGWNAWILGVIITVMALWALAAPKVSAPEWINAIAGIWLFIAPWALGFHRVTHASAWNQWIVGVIVFVLAVWVIGALRGTHQSRQRTT
jgi:hypothetical protein